MRFAVEPAQYRRPSPTEAFSLFVVAAAAVIVPLTYAWQVSLPTSILREVFGIPCPLCGGTRAVTALCLGRLYEAVAYNPLALAIFAFMVVSISRYLFVVLPWGVRPVVQVTRVEERVIWVLCGVAFVANWIYVLRAGMFERPLIL